MQARAPGTLQTSHDPLVASSARVPHAGGTEDDVEPKLSFWDACKEKLDNENAQRDRTAARYRTAAKELGAVPGEKPGEWQLRCPHCGVVTIISEDGWVGRRGPGPGSCTATGEIQRYCASRSTP
jgi:hypothetical protein